MSVSALIVAAAASSATLSPADTASAFRAAGFVRKAGQWQSCGDPGTPAYTPGTIEEVRDLNADGQPEAIIVEASSFCFGNTGQSYTIVSKRVGGWIKITEGTGIVEVLKTKGVANWPDLSIGGPGFCFPVERWNGKAYALHRFQYEGRPCKPRK